MDEQDVKGLQNLVSNKHQKSYTRMVSQEFSSAERRQPLQGGRARRRSKKSSSSVTETDNAAAETHAEGGKSDSEESEYFSAEEEVDLFDSDKSTDNNSLDESDQHTDSVFSSTQATAKTCSVPRLHTKAPSKKQKRKRRQSKPESETALFPFANIDNLDIDFIELNEELSHVSCTTVREVPSLQHLSILASRNLAPQNKISPLPQGLKPILTLSYARLGLQKNQLSWLFKLLSHFGLKEEAFRTKFFCYDLKLPFPYRNIWSSESYHIDLLSEMDSTHVYRSCHAACYIPYTSMWGTNHTFPLTFYGHSIEDKIIGSMFQLSAMANTIDLMLPPTIRQGSKIRKSRTSSQSEEDIISTAVDGIVARVRNMLEKRYPHAVKHLFDMVLPYVFWARGNTSKAAHLFSEMAAKETSCRKMARYLYEIGRMYAHFDESDTAIAFFKGASDAATNKPKNKQPAIMKEVTLQTLALCADTFDHGPMTPYKAQQAKSSWRIAVCTEDFKVDKFSTMLCIHAADSLLCYHAGIGTDDVASWLRDSIQELERLGQSCTSVYLYQSQLYAWAGQVKESQTAYRKFLSGYAEEYNSAPGQGISSHQGSRDRQPWRVLVQMVQGPATAPKPLVVHWRTRLGSLRLDCTYHPGSWESDVKSEAVNLCLSKEGNISGDLQMVLPPIRGVQLDPHTGLLCFPELPGDTINWKSSYTFCSHDGVRIPLLPTPMEVFCDYHGNKVHLLSSSMTAALPNFSVQSDYNVLIWTGADGRRSKVNLSVKVRETVYEDALRTVNNIEDKEMKTRRKNLLKKCFDKGQLMDVNNMTNHIKAEMVYEEKVRKGGKAKKYQLPAKYTASMFLCDVRQPALFSSTVVIPIMYPAQTNNMSTYLIFVDCSCMETFSTPKLVKCDFQDFLMMDIFKYFNSPLPKTLSYPHADLIAVQNSSRNVTLYDKFGEQFDELNVALVNQESCIPQVYKNQAYFISMENKLATSLNGIITTVELFGEVDRMVVCRHVIVMTTAVGLVFADSVSFLPLTVLVGDKIRPSLPNGVEYGHTVKHFYLVGEKEIVKNSGIKYNMVALAIDTHLVVVEIPLCEEPEFIEMIMCVELPGLAKDVCFINDQMGVLVSVTLHTRSSYYPRETLYHLTYSGHLLGILPGLGAGPRSFLPLMLPCTLEGEGSDRRVWHVYMRDGHDGIMCVLLS